MKNQAIARRYAQALLTLGRENGRYQDYEQSLTEVSALFSEAGVSKIMTSPLYTMEARKELLNAILSRLDLESTLANFIRLVLDKKRFDELSDISRRYSHLVDEANGLKRARLITASPLSPENIAAVAQALERFTNSKVSITVSEDPSLIGGVIATLGDLTIDGSVRTQLKNLTRALTAGAY